MFGKNKWYKTALKLYRKGRMNAPYEMLFRYYLGMRLQSDGHGHYDFFDMLEFDGISLDATVEELKKSLPEKLSENFLVAVKKYRELGEEPEVDDIVNAFIDCDIYAEEHASEIADMVRAYIEEK